ncbi:MAG: trehalose-phosphatase, partial [Candidatus Omnitrophica bacterium]|nr:trehalose-phosphatase [Candidatus Omnitrophota bacterium]
RKALAQKLEGIKGVIIEDKVLTISVHYRMVEQRNVPLVKTIFHEAVILYVVKGLVTIHQGKKTLEIRPSFNWDKGKIVLWLLARERFLNSGDTVIPVYIGDDTTDEDAFRVLRKEGFTIFVGKPVKTFAEYYLKDPGDVNVFLDRVIRMSGKERP